MPSEIAADTVSGWSAGSPAQVSDQLGPAARCVFVLRPASGGRRTAALALELAERIGAGRPRTLLLELDGRDRELDRLQGVGDAPGLTAAFRGEARMSDVTVRRDGQSFMYLPAGADAAPPGTLLSSRAMAHLVERARAGGATVLIHVNPGDLPPVDALPDMDGTLLLGAAGSGEAPASVPLLGRVTRPPAAEAPAADALSVEEPAARGPAPWDDPGSLVAPVAPMASGLASLASRMPVLRRVRSTWRQVALLCGLALALGFFIAWVGAHDLWQEWLNWSADVKGQAR